MSWQGKIVRARLRLRRERLTVLLTVRSDGARCRTVELPDRELAALLPRTILLGEADCAPRALLETAAAVIERMTVGRRVLVREENRLPSARFLSWRSVRFPAEEGPVPGLHDDSEGHGDVQGALGSGHGN